MMVQDLILNKPVLQSDQRYCGLAADTKPIVGIDGSPLLVGTEFREEDTGISSYWTGTAWQPTSFTQKLDQLVELNIEILDYLRKLAS